MDPPPKFSFEPKDWKTQKAHFERYRKATDLTIEPENDQITALLYLIGLESENIYNSSTFEKKESKENTMEWFQNLMIILCRSKVLFMNGMCFFAFPIDWGVIWEIHNRPHKLAKTCEFDEMRDKTIRERIVVGISDPDVSRQLLMDRNPTLAEVIETVRMAELITK